MESPWGQRSSVGSCVFFFMRVCISHLNQDQLALGGRVCMAALKVPSSIFTCGFVTSPRLCKNLCTLLDTSNCVLWLCRTIFAVWMWKTAVWKSICDYVDFWRKITSKNQTITSAEKQQEKYRWEKKIWYCGWSVQEREGWKPMCSLWIFARRNVLLSCSWTSFLSLVRVLILWPRAILQGCVFKCCAWESEALQSYKIHKTGRNFGFCLSLRLVEAASAELLAWGALGLADC